MSALDTFQDFVAQMPEVLQPVAVALVGAVPFVEGEGAVTVGIIGGIHPLVAGIAAVAGNILCVLVFARQLVSTIRVAGTAEGDTELSPPKMIKHSSIHDTSTLSLPSTRRIM